MSNAFKNTDLVTKFAVREFLNSLILSKKVDRQLDMSKVFSGKVGATALVRRPILFESTPSAILSNSDIEEATIPVILNQRHHVAFIVTSEDLALRIEDANTRYIRPAMQELAQVVESVVADQYSEIANFVGVPGTNPSSFLDVARAKSLLSKIGVPYSPRCAFYDADASISLADGLKSVFPERIAKTAIEEAEIGRFAGFDLYESNSLKTHTVGVNTGTPLVDGPNQDVVYETAKDTDSQTLVTDGWTAGTPGILLRGDVFTIAAVNSVNRRTRETTGSLQQFTVLSDANSGVGGSTSFTIAPPMITSGPYKTVDSPPIDNALITVISGVGGETYRQNIAFHKNAITLACGQLDLITEGATGSRQNFMGVSIKTQRQYVIGNDSLQYRFDILFGIKVQNRDFAVRTTS